jgi:serine/threonine protein phosphatase 1
MKTFLGDIEIGPSWLYYGGAETLASYGIEASSLEQDTEKLTAHQQALKNALPAHHLEFLENLPLTHREGDYFFTHAGVRPGIALEDQKARDLMWIRERFLHSSRDHGCVVVHGHTVTSAPVVKANRIGIDTGAYDSGVLTCLALEGPAQRFIQTE